MGTFFGKRSKHAIVSTIMTGSLFSKTSVNRYHKSTENGYRKPSLWHHRPIPLLLYHPVRNSRQLYHHLRILDPLLPRPHRVHRTRSCSDTILDSWTTDIVFSTKSTNPAYKII